MCAQELHWSVRNVKNRNYNMTKDKKAHPDRMETEKILQILQITHTAQRNEVVVRGKWNYE